MNYRSFTFFSFLIFLFVSLTAQAQLNNQELNKKITSLYGQINNRGEIICKQKELTKKQINARKQFKKFLIISAIKDTYYSKVKNSLMRKFQLRDLSKDNQFEFEVSYRLNNVSNPPSFNLVIDEHNLSFSGEINSGSYFSLTGTNVSPSKKEVGDDIFEALSLAHFYCVVNYARSDQLMLSHDKDIHISVHPHTSYDRYNTKISPQIDHELKDQSKNHIVLLDHHSNYEFSDLKQYLINGRTTINRSWKVGINLPRKLSGNLDQTFYVAPYGYINYHFRDKHPSQFPQILYTGGFHNYCMTFNLIELGNLYLSTQVTNQLNVIFKTSAIIMQKRGYETSASGRMKNKSLKPISLKRKHLKYSNHMSYFFENFPITGQKYLNNHLYNISQELKQNSLHYRTLTISYDYLGEYSNTITLSGSGILDKSIQLNYIK